MIMRAFTMSLLLAAPALAEETPMTGAQFRALTEGYTLHVEDESGAYYGSDQFPGDNQSIWLPSEGACLHGVWGEVEDKICFLYEMSVPACWRVFRDGIAGARFERAPIPGLDDAEQPDGEGRLILRLTNRDRRPIICPDGPGV